MHAVIKNFEKNLISYSGIYTFKWSILRRKGFHTLFNRPNWALLALSVINRQKWYSTVKFKMATNNYTTHFMAIEKNEIIMASSCLVNTVIIINNKILNFNIHNALWQYTLCTLPGILNFFFRLSNSKTKCNSCTSRKREMEYLECSTYVHTNAITLLLLSQKIMDTKYVDLHVLASNTF